MENLRIQDIIDAEVGKKAYAYAINHTQHISKEEIWLRDLPVAFTWSDTEEGHDFWSIINQGGGAYKFKKPYTGIRIKDISNAGVKIKAIKNAIEANVGMSIKESLEHKLNNVFTWDSTKEGHAFWSAVENSERLQQEYEEEKEESGSESESKTEAELEFKIGDLFAINGSSYKYRMCQTGINEVALIDNETCLCYDEGSIKVADIVSAMSSAGITALTLIRILTAPASFLSVGINID